MDPDANLAEQQAIIAKYKARGYVHMDDAKRLAELFAALDEWIERGGFLPAAWKPKPSEYASAPNAYQLDHPRPSRADRLVEAVSLLNEHELAREEGRSPDTAQSLLDVAMNLLVDVEDNEDMAGALSEMWPHDEGEPSPIEDLVNRYNKLKGI